MVTVSIGSHQAKPRAGLPESAVAPAPANASRRGALRVLHVAQLQEGEFESSAVNPARVREASVSSFAAKMR
jgi:hypothetical protein